MASQSRGDWPGAVVFDLDGTLVDSAPDIGRALSAAFEPYGSRPFSGHDAQRLIGGGAAVAIDKAIAMLGLSLGEGERAASLDRFFTAYAMVSAEGNGLFPGTREMLDQLAAQGVARAIVTNKAQHITDIAVPALGIADAFGAVIGVREDVPKKPHPAMLHLALEQLGLTVADAVFVGDSPADAGVAKAAGCPLIMVDFGYTSTPVGELGADAIISHLGDLPAAVSQVWRRRGSGR